MMHKSEGDEPRERLAGSIILIVQRHWVLASSLGNAFQAKGAEVLIAQDASSALSVADVPNLAAAVLNSQSGPLCEQLDRRAIPFVVYTGRQDVDDTCGQGEIIRKPANVAEVVESVMRLLR